MLSFYWGLLLVGASFAVITVLFGDFLSDALDGMLDFLSGDVVEWLQPMVLFSAITVLGGAGILLTKYSSIAPLIIFLLALLTAVGCAVPIYLLYVKPMQNSENSVAYSIRDMIGAIAEVTVPIPAHGTGEIIVKAGAGVTNQMAESFEGKDIEAGARVVTVDVKDGVLLVSRLDIEL